MGIVLTSAVQNPCQTLFGGARARAPSWLPLARTLNERQAGYKLDSSRLVRAVPSLPATCPVCLDSKEFLIANADCSHAACEVCWSTWAESQLTEIEEKRLLRPRCFGYCCEKPVAEDLWCVLGAENALRAFAAEVAAAVQSLRRIPHRILTWAPRACDDGPVCEVCREHSYALIVNECGHAACVDC